MTGGEISARYARALLKYAESEVLKDELYHEVQRLLDNPAESSPDISQALGKFVELVRNNGRIDLIRRIFQTFLALYRESEGIVHARLVTAVELPGLEPAVRSSLESATGKKVELEQSVDPRLIGGFVLHTDEILLDASVRRRIDDIRRKFVINANRIV